MLVGGATKFDGQNIAWSPFKCGNSENLQHIVYQSYSFFL